MRKCRDDVLVVNPPIQDTVTMLSNAGSNEALYLLLLAAWRELCKAFLFRYWKMLGRDFWSKAQACF